MPDKVKILYDAVSKDYDIGTYEEFNGKLQDPAKRKAFFDGVGAEYDLGTYQDFESKVGVKKKEPTSGIGGGRFLATTGESKLPLQNDKLDPNAISQSVGKRQTPKLTETSTIEEVFSQTDPNQLISNQDGSPMGGTAPIIDTKFQEKLKTDRAKSNVDMERASKRLIQSSPLLASLQEKQNLEREGAYNDYVSTVPQGIIPKTQAEFEVSDDNPKNQLLKSEYKDYLKSQRKLTEEQLANEGLVDDGALAGESTMTFEQFKEFNDFDKSTPNSLEKEVTIKTFGGQRNNTGIENQIYKYFLENPTIAQEVADLTADGSQLDDVRKAKIIKAATYPKINEKQKYVEDLALAGANNVFENAKAFDVTIKNNQSRLEGLQNKIKQNPQYSAYASNKPLDESNPQVKQLQKDVEEYNALLGETQVATQGIQEYMSNPDNAYLFNEYLDQTEGLARYQNAVQNNLDRLGGYQEYLRKQEELDASGSKLTNFGKTVWNSIAKTGTNLLTSTASITENVTEAMGAENTMVGRGARKFENIVNAFTEDNLIMQGRTREKMGTFENIMNELGDQTGNIISLIAMGRPIYNNTLSSLSKAGATAKELEAAKTMATIKAVIIPSYLTTYSDYKKTAEELGFEGKSKALFSHLGALAEGVSELIFPDFKLFMKDYATKNLKELAKKRITDPNKAFDEYLKGGLDAFLKGGAEETSVDYFNALNTYVNNIIAGNDKGIDFPKLGETVHTFAIGGLMEGGVYSLSRLGGNAANKEIDLKLASDFENSKEIIQGMIDNGEVQPNIAEAYINKINNYANELSNLPNYLSENQRAAILPLQVEISKLNEDNKNPNLAEAFKKENTAKVDELNEQITNIMRNPKFDEEFEKEKEQAFEGKEIEAGVQIDPSIVVENDTKENPTDATIAQVQKEGDQVVMPSKIEGISDRLVEFKDGEWQQKVGDIYTKLPKQIQDEAAELFNKIEDSPETINNSPTEQLTNVTETPIPEPINTENVEITINKDGKQELTEETNIPDSEPTKPTEQGERLDYDVNLKEELDFNAIQEKAKSGELIIDEHGKFKTLAWHSKDERLKVTSKDASEKGKNYQEYSIKLDGKTIAKTKTYNDALKYTQMYFDNNLKNENISISEKEQLTKTKDKELTPEPIIEKTPKELARERIKTISQKIKSKQANLGVSNDPKENAKDLYELHSAYVEYAKEVIKEGITTAKEFAESLGEKLNKTIKQAWNEANGGEPLSVEDFSDETNKVQVSQEFSEKVFKNLESDEIRQTLSNIERETGSELTDEQKEFNAIKTKEAVEHGFDVIESSKKEFGNDYVKKTLEYLDENKSRIDPDTRSLLTISLELDLERQLLNNPANEPTLRKQLEYVRNRVIKEQRSVARALGYGHLRQMAREGYDIKAYTDSFKSNAELRQQRKIEKAIQADVDAINKEAEVLETEPQTEVEFKKPTGAKLKKAQENVKKAKAEFDDFIKKSRGQAGSFADVATFVAKASKLIKAYGELGIVKIEDVIAKMIEDYGQDFVDENKENIQKAYDKAKGITTPKTPEERLENAKENTRDRIESIKKQIEDKKRELKERNVVEKDLELRKLEAEEKALKEELNKVVPLSIDEFSRKRKAQLETELFKLDEQIENKKRKVRENNEDPIYNQEVIDLEAKRKAKIDLLNEIDPLPKEVVKRALIDAGFGREITVKTAEGKEKRAILDWKKLTGEEGSVDNIKENTEKYLKSKGWSDADISRINEGLIEEYNRLRESVIEKSLAQLESENIQKTRTERKSSARRLAELYNMGLFEKEADTYDYLMNKALGLSGLRQEIFFEGKKLAQSLSKLYSYRVDGKPMDDFYIKGAIKEVNQKISNLLTKQAYYDSNALFKTVTALQEAMNLSQRFLLVSPKQAIENPLSGLRQDFVSKVAAQMGGTMTPELKKQINEVSKSVYKSVVREGGEVYGDVTTPFLNRSIVEDWLKGKIKGKVAHAALSAATGEAFLNGADSAFKSSITEGYFAHNLIKILSDKSLPNHMSKEDARKKVSELLTGQNFEESKKVALDLINMVNREHGKKLLSDSPDNINRMAMDIVKMNIVTQTPLTKEMVVAAYKSAYKAAGLDMGHEANNVLSFMMGKVNASIETKIREAIKNKDYNEAAAWKGVAIMTRNIMNPFLSGGTNWTMLGLQWSGLYPITAIVNNIRNAGKTLDLGTEEGVKNMEKTLYSNLKTRNANIRYVVGAINAAVMYGIALGTDKDETWEEFLKKNSLSKYGNIITPEIWAIMAAERNGKLGEYFANRFGQNPRYDEKAKFFKAVGDLSKGVNEKNDFLINKGVGELAAIMGGKLNAPLPYKLVNDGKDLVNIAQGKPIQAKDWESIGFWNGYFRDGVVPSLGFRPEKLYKTDVRSALDVDKDAKLLDLIAEKGLKIQASSDKEFAFNDGGVRSLSPKKAQEYDKTYTDYVKEELYKDFDKIKEYDEKELKSYISDLKKNATTIASANLNLINENDISFTFDKKKYEFTPKQIGQMYKYISEYKKSKEYEKSKKFYEKMNKEAEKRKEPIEDVRIMLWKEAVGYAKEKVKDENIDNKGNINIPEKP